MAKAQGKYLWVTTAEQQQGWAMRRGARLCICRSQGKCGARQRQTSVDCTFLMESILRGHRTGPPPISWSSNTAEAQQKTINQSCVGPRGRAQRLQRSASAWFFCASTHTLSMHRPCFEGAETPRQTVRYQRFKSDHFPGAQRHQRGRRAPQLWSAGKDPLRGARGP